MSGVLTTMMSAGVIARLFGDTCTSIVSHPSTATASVFFSGGFETGTDNGPYTWLKSGSASNYEIFATLNSGTVTGDSFSTWLNLGTSRSWSLTESSIGTKLGSITLQLRPVGGSVISTATISFTAEVD
jgi:hypothetical protein